MKVLLRITILFLVATLFFSSCTEVGPTITVEPPKRKVLLEEFTGVICNNCVEAHNKVDALSDLHGENLIVVAIHTGFFATPDVGNAYDFRIPEGADLNSLLGPVSSLPSGCVNRQLFTGENALWVGSNSWAGYIASEISKESPIDLKLTTTFDEATRALTIKPEIILYQNIEDPINISVMLTETNIIDAQLDGTGTIPDYVHKHVLRDMVTNSIGNPLSGTTLANSPLTEQFNTVIPTDWNADNVYVVVSIHYPSPNYSVLQVEEAPIN